MDKIFIACVLFFTFLCHADADCTFPEALYGKWDGGVDPDTQTSITFEFEDNKLKDFPVNVFLLSKNDFSCRIEESKGEITKFVLKGSDTITVFTTKFVMYFCLTIQDDAGTMKYAIDTDDEPQAGRRLHITREIDPEPSFEDVCNEDNTLSIMTKTSKRNIQDFKKLLRKIEEELN